MLSINLLQDQPLPAEIHSLLAPNLDATAAPGVAADELLSRPGTLVWLHTRTGLHAEWAIKALQAGKDVVCNAPLCITGAAAWQILETAKYTRRRLLVPRPQCRFWHQLKEELGTVQRIHAWARVPDTDPGELFPDGGLLYTGIYPFAEALSILVGTPDSVTGTLETGTDGKETGGHAELALADGGTAFFDWTNADESAPGFSLKAEGTNGTANISGTIIDGALRIGNIDSTLELRDPGVGSSFTQDISAFLEGSVPESWEPFGALRAAELIDRIYSRIR